MEHNQLPTSVSSSLTPEQLAALYSTPKTEKLSHDVGDPITRMKGCGQSIVMFFFGMVVVVSTFVQLEQDELEELQRQEIYERIQALQVGQQETTEFCKALLLRLDSVEETVDSVEETVEAVEEGIDYDGKSFP